MSPEGLEEKIEAAMAKMEFKPHLTAEEMENLQEHVRQLRAGEIEPPFREYRKSYFDPAWETPQPGSVSDDRELPPRGSVSV